MNSKNFFNPYNFVSTPKRNLDDDVLGDARPIGHSRIEEGTLSGKLVIKMVAETPLLIPSSDVSVDKNNHRSRKTRTIGGATDNAGKRLEPFVAIPSSSVKGMVRSAYEMITNSRYSVFTGHDDRLGMREATSDALLAIPAVVIVENENPKLRLLLGNKTLKDLKTNGDGYLSWENQGDRDKASLAARVSMSDVDIFGRGEFDSMVNFTYDKETMRVRELDVDPSTPGMCVGYVHKSGKPGTTDGRGGIPKENERVFFAESAENAIDIPLTEDIAQYWRDIIRDSTSVNADVADAHRPLYTKGSEHAEWAELSKGNTCFARVKEVNRTYQIELVQPVHIGRELHPKSPAEALDSTLQPAVGFDSFSSAERVFGWATNGKVEPPRNQNAYAGHVRFSPVYCKSPDPIEKFESGRILAILNSPKPSMARFYAGVRHQNGEVFFDPKTLKKKALYDGKSMLRGRKVYPHHGSFDSSSTQWQSSAKAKVNQSILDWIKPETEFEFSIQFRNITPAEFGALVASIQTGEGQCHRLGGGRPLGFGAVSLKIDFDQSKVMTHESLSQSWENCETAKFLPADYLSALEMKFRERVQGESFYKTFVSYLNGYANAEGIQVAYPRSSPDATKPDAILEWFVENERTVSGVPVHGLPLPQIGAALKNSLPYISRPPRPDNRGGNNNRGGQGGGGGRPRR
jgi:CRISPR-associated protein (TIGR03986 family)